MNQHENDMIKNRKKWMVGIVLFNTVGIFVSFFLAFGFAMSGEGSEGDALKQAAWAGNASLFVGYILSLIIIITFFFNKKYLSKIAILFFIFYLLFFILHSYVMFEAYFL